MDITAFVTVYGDTGIHEYIQAQARRHTRNVELQKDLCQEAWMRISEEPTGQRATEWYLDLARRAIHTAWKRDYRLRKNDQSVREYYCDWYSSRYE